MKTKKLIAGLISAVTMAAISTSAIVSAAGLTAKISSAEVAAGDDFTLTLNLSDIPSNGINGCEFGISYDPALVTVSGLALCDGVYANDEGLGGPLEYNVESDVVSVMYSIGSANAADYLKGNVDFLTISGKVNAAAEGGSKADFEIVPIDRAVSPGSSTTNVDVIFGYMSEDDTIIKYDATYVKGTVTVKGAGTIPTESKPTDGPTPTESKPTDGPTPTESKPTDSPTPTKGDGPTVNIGTPSMYGDVNLDGGVDIADVVELNMYLLDQNANPLQSDVAAANADVVRDEKIEAADSALILNYTAMMIPITELGK